jgi:hypothetical protein
MLLEYTLRALVAATVILSSTARNAIATRWRKLIETVRDPYQPELHCMRGPGQSGALNTKQTELGLPVPIDEQYGLVIESDEQMFECSFSFMKSSLASSQSICASIATANYRMALPKEKSGSSVLIL